MKLSGKRTKDGVASVSEHGASRAGAVGLYPPHMEPCAERKEDVLYELWVKFVVHNS